MEKIMPPVMYGTAWKKEATADLVEMAVHTGFRGIDTACQPKHYHEAGVGEAIRRLAEQGIHRDELFIQTKFTPLGGQDPQRIPYDPRASLDLQVVESLRVSKHNLGVSKIDSLFLHSPLYPYEHLLTVWKTMEKFVENGDVGIIGISNCYDINLFVQLYNDATIKPSVLQNRFYQESGYDVQLRSWCDEKNIVYQSFWTLTANPHLLRSPLFQTLAQNYGVQTPQILYRYLSQIGVVPLIGSTSKEHLEEDLKITQFKLEEGEISEIKKAIEG